MTFMLVFIIADYFLLLNQLFYGLPKIARSFDDILDCYKKKGRRQSFYW